MIKKNEKLDKERFKKKFKVKIYNFTLRIVKFVDQLSKDSSSQIIANQLLRSATSIGANYIEAQASSSRKDFINFFHHSLKSANETLFWLAILRDSKKTDYNQTQELIRELSEISKILGSSLLTLKGRK